MFERDVTVSLNADVSGYTSSLSQAIAITKQYQDSTTGVLASIAKLSSATVSGIVGMAPGLTGARRVITDTAAAYQQQLSGIAAATVNTSASIEGVSKSTRQLARDFPVGMGQAVQQVMSLKSAGVVTEKEISKLGVAFTKLGAANNAFGPELGQQMLQVTRQFGNGTAQIEALGDSLTTVTKQWGANASSVLTFSKAIAPIASTVGMSQTQVMGLSTAMSRLGEDGYAAGNAVNKVLLDMNKAVRQGGPELKVYADLMGMTAENLRSLAKTNPSEVLTKFTEAIAKQGPAAQRPLEALGFDSVRTTRAITSLANTGNLREIMDTAVKAYGNGETERSAAEAFGTVNDKMQELQETMSQTMENLGKPFLKFTGVVLTAGKAAAGATEKVTGSGLFQNAATGGILAGAVAGGAWKMLSATTTGSMLLNLFRSGRDSQFAKDFGSGREMGRMGYTGSNVQGANAATRLGMLAGNVQGPPAAPGAGVGAIGSVRDRVAQTARMAVGAGTRVTDSLANENARAGGRPVVPMTPTGVALRTALGDAIRGRDMQTLQAASGATSRYLSGLAQSGTLGRVAGSAGMYAVEGGRQALVYGARGIGVIGRGASALGLNPAMLGVAGAGLGAYMLYQQEQQNYALRSGITNDSSKDIFSSFNSFAEAAGVAGRGLVDFTAAVRQATSSLASQATTWDKAKTLTGEEQAQATAPGYARAFSITGDAAKGGPGAVDAIVEQAKMTLGVSATPEAVKKLTMDVLNQTKDSGLANTLANRLADQYGQTAQPIKVDYATVIKDLARNASAFALGSSEETAKLGTDLGRSIAQQGYQTEQARGPEAGRIVALAETKKAFGIAQSELNQMPGVGLDSSRRTQAASAFNAMLTSALGLSEEQMAEIFGNPNQQKDFLMGGSWAELEKKLRAYSSEKGVSIPALDVIDAANRNNIDLNNPQFAGTAYDKPTSLEEQSKGLVHNFEEMTGVVATTSDSLFAMNSAARQFEKDATQLTPEDMRNSGMSRSGQLVTQAYQNETVGSVTAAAISQVMDALRNSGGRTAIAEAELRRSAAIAPADTRERIMQEALRQAESITAPREAARPELQRTLDTYRVGRMAQQQVSRTGYATDEATAQVQVGEITAGRTAQATMISNIRNFMLQAKQTEVAIGQMQAAAGRQSAQVQRDYNLQVQYANEDYQRTRLRATRDFNIQMSRMDRDYGIQRQRAVRDFNRQANWMEQDHNRDLRYARQDFNRQMTRMAQSFNRQVERSEADYRVSVMRAERDYIRQRTRAVRDFNIGLLRMEQDYNRQKDRATEDYNIGVARAEHDYRVARERATRDFNKQQGYAETDYLKQRGRAQEDFTKQMRRIVEDSAKSMHDPWKRIQAQLVMDGDQLVANLREQNTSVRKQMEALDTLRGAGLSQSAIDILGLGDTKNAQQTMRLLADSLTDPTMIARINEQIAGRIDLSAMVNSGDNNQQARRAAEDFATQLERMDADFKASSARAADAFNTSMSDMATDYETQMARGAEDFNKSLARMEQDYNTTVARATEDHNRALQDMAVDYKTMLEDMAKDRERALQYMTEDYQTAVTQATEDYFTAIARMQEGYDTVVARSRKQFDTQLRDMAADHKKIRKDAQADFDRQMADMAENLQVQLGRMATAVGNALSDIGAALAAQIDAAQKALIGFGQTVSAKETQLYKQFADYISGLPADQKEKMGESLKAMMEYLSIQAPKIFRQYFPNGIAGVFLPTPTTTIPSPQDRGENAGPPQPTPANPNAPMGVFQMWPNGYPESLRAEWKKVGEESFAGFVEGLSPANPARWVMEPVQGVVDAFKRLLGIQSPSKVFADIGKDTMAGFVKGIVDNIPGVMFLRDKLSPIFDSPNGLSGYLKGLPDSISDWIGSGNMLKSIVDVLPLSSQLKKAIGDRFTDFNLFFDNLPENVNKAIGQNTILKKIDEAFPGTKELATMVAGIFKDAKDFFVGLPAAVYDWIVGRKTIKQYIMESFPSVGDLFNAVKDLFEGNGKNNSLSDYLSNLGTKISGWIGKSGIGTAFNAIWTSMKTMLHNFVEGWNKLDIGISFTIPNFVPGVGGQKWEINDVFPDITPNPFALGGVVTGPTNALIGEAGPEAVVPLNQRGAQVMADAMKTYLGATVFDGSLGNPTVINVSMADVNIDFTDSGSEFESQVEELLRLVREAARTAADVVDANAQKITADVDDVSKALEAMAQAVSDAFDTSTASLEEALKGAANSTNEETRSIAQSFTTMTDAMDTDLSDLVTGFDTSVTSIISSTERLISDAIQRIEDFANSDWVPSDPGGTDGGGDGGGTDGGNDGGGQQTGWSTFSTAYQALNSTDQSFVNGLFGGKPPTEQAFSALSSAQQAALAVAAPDGLTAEERAGLTSLFPKSGNPGGGNPGSGRDTSFTNFNTLQQALGSSDQKFLTAAFGGKAPTAKVWHSLTQQQRDKLIDALEDKDLSTSERATISSLGLSGGPGETGDTGDSTKNSWTAFRTGYDQLGEHDKARVDKVFGGKPTFDAWTTLTETQQRRMRDIVRDGNISKDESSDFGDLGYKVLGKQIVDYAMKYKGVPYSLNANPPSTFDCSKFTSWVYRHFGVNVDAYSDTQFSGGKNVTGEELPGDLVFFHTNDAKVTGHVGLYIGGGNMIDAPSPGDVVSINTATSRGDYKGARRYFAEGGVVNRRQEAVIGEAGPEVVMPLNDRGAEFFASVMQRYASPQDSQRALVSPYSTPVNVSISQTYDNRTVFTGPIAVSANDPEELAARTAAKQRRQRLSQPIGSAR